MLSTASPSFLPRVPLMKPRTVWACQLVAVMISSRVAPAGRRSNSSTAAFLLPSRVVGVSSLTFGAWRDTSRLWRRLGAQALDRLPNPHHSAAAVGELLHRLQVVEGRDPGEAVPCVGQGAQGPSGGEVGQWKRLVKLLLRLRVLTDADGMVLANLCQAWSTLVKAQVKMNETGLLLKTPSG